MKDSRAWTSRRADDPKRRSDVRDPHERDLSRVIHSASFRRLQAKTQVLGVGEGDFHRTRLTHSLEVAQIGRGLVAHLQHSRLVGEPARLVLPGDALIEVVCLSHDLGHPPFGHGGERALHYCMRDFGGFEGNAQTLRVLSRLEKHSKKNGLNLTRRALLGVLKYPVSFSKAARFSPLEVPNVRHLGRSHSKPPKCYYDVDKDVVDWILDPFDPRDREALARVMEPDKSKQHAKPMHRSLTASIMELADDIAYGIHDLEDMVALGLFTMEAWKRLIGEPLGDRKPKGLTSVRRDLFADATFRRKRAVGWLVNHFISASRVKGVSGFRHDLLKWRAYLPPRERTFLDLLRDAVIEGVVRRAEVQTLEFHGQQVVWHLFEAISSDPKNLLPSHQRSLLRGDADHDMRVVGDYVAGMTDAYATRFYERLFVPRVGTVFEPL
jgi:dGTPase